MEVQVNLAGKKGFSASRAYITDGEKSWSNAEFSEAEIRYIKNRLKEKQDFISLPRAGEFVFIQVVGKETSAEKLRKNGAAACALLNREKIAGLTLLDEKGDKASLLAFAEGILLAGYRFLKYRSDADEGKNSLEKLLIHSEAVDKTDIHRLTSTCKAVFFARNLVNEPQSYLNALQLATELENMAGEAGLKVEVLNKTKIEALKMGGLLAVNQGSHLPPTFTILEWKPGKAVNKKPVVLVGKGVVYDTGGLSLKPTLNSMDFMKSDMAGAAAVAGAMYAVALQKLPVHIIGLIPATDNRPGQDAYAPGDIVRMHNGKTVEVLNTDAEGRMLLADALSYAGKFRPELVMDFATLTGAAAAAIGPYGIVCMGTASDKVKSRLISCGEDVYERLAELPLWEEYGELIKSDIADMKNIGGPVGGAITAGKFLEHFVDYPWMHFDIAGPAYVPKNDSYRGKNASGVGVRLLVSYFQKMSGK
jgi:leucyl aminopeptidase